MEMLEEDWRRWPLTGAGAALEPDSDFDKVAYEVPEVSVEALATRAAEMMGVWAPELPSGIDKVAARRGDGDELPRVTAANIWRHPNAHPAALSLLLLDRYGQEMVEWEPEVLLKTLVRDQIELSNANRTKILAARAALHSPSPWRQWEVFHWTCLGLGGLAPNFVYLEEPEIGYLVAGYDFLQLVDPKRQTSEETDKFIAAVFKTEGLPFIPAPLHFAQRELEQRQLRCRACEAIHRDDNDQRCVTCASTQLEPVPYEFAELRDQVKSLWMKLKKLPLETAVDHTPNNAVGNAVYRLLIHWDYALQTRTHMAQQLRMLGE
jgi:hypothetical protein